MKQYAERPVVALEASSLISPFLWRGILIRADLWAQRSNARSMSSGKRSRMLCCWQARYEQVTDLTPVYVVEPLRRLGSPCRRPR